MRKSSAWKAVVISLLGVFALSGCAKVRLLRKAAVATDAPSSQSNSGSTASAFPPATGSVVVSGGGFASSASMRAMISVGSPVSSVVVTGAGASAYLGPQGILVSP